MTYDNNLYKPSGSLYYYAPANPYLSYVIMVASIMEKSKKNPWMGRLAGNIDIWLNDSSEDVLETWCIDYVHKD